MNSFHVIFFFSRHIIYFFSVFFNIFNKITLAAFGVAVAFVFSCSSDDGEEAKRSSSSGSLSSSSDINSSSSVVSSSSSSSDGSSSSNGGSSSSDFDGSSSSEAEVSSSSSSAGSSLSSSTICTAMENTETHYCFKETIMKEYGFVEDAAGKVYKTVVIGEQVWMAENLNYVPTSGNSACPESSENCKKYGRLYNWSTAGNVCPTGWHLPDNDEWGELLRYVDGGTGRSMPSMPCSSYNSFTAGNHLKATNMNGLDAYGFSALPGGSGDQSGYFYDVGTFGYWWSASEHNNPNACLWRMAYDNDPAFQYDFDKRNLYSVRCVRD